MNCELHKGDCLELMKELPSESVNVILTDPPYLYLKNQKLDRPFDEQVFFSEAKRILKKDGFIVLFGRGTSFYRWNTMLAELGFNFKEEIIWNKKRTSSPLLNLNRLHETISIHSKGKAFINKNRVPYIESTVEIDTILSDIKRIMPILNNPAEFLDVKNYLITKKIKNRYNREHLSATVSSNISTPSPCVNTVRAIIDGKIEKDIITTVIEECTPRKKDIHPTQKPTRLLERLLALVSKEGDLVVDPFSGSGSTAIACMNSNRKFIGFEIDDEYYQAAHNRIQTALSEKQKEAVQTELFSEVI